MKKDKKVHLAILGTRGIPASYGGFETFAEEISKRFIEIGYEVSVYQRHSFFKNPGMLKDIDGVKRISSPTIMHKYAETPLHSLTSFVDVLFRKVDLILLCNAANSPFSWIAKLRGIPVYTNVDGIERNRTKWNMFGRLWYFLGERSAVLFSKKIICDAQFIADYYKERYRAESEIITYGATVRSQIESAVLEEFGLEKGKYVLYVSRLEPENNALGVVEAYSRVSGDLPLVVVGDAPYAKDYIEKVKQSADKRVIFTGYQFGDAYHKLRSNCMFYIQATEVGGTHPALVEAMAYGNAIIANDVPEHREVLLECGLYYEKNNFIELSAKIEEFLGSEDLRKKLSSKASARAKEYFTWDAVCKKYREMFEVL